MRLLSYFTIYCLFVLCGPACYAGGGGTQIHAQDAFSAGLANVNVSTPIGLSSVFYNPGMMPNSRPGIQIGGTASFDQGQFQAYGSTQLPSQWEDSPLYLPNLYLSFPLNLGLSKLDDNKQLYLGLSVNRPYAHHTVYPNDWQGRSIVLSSTFNSIYIQPTVSYPLTEKISLGAGIVIVRMDYAQTRALPYDTNPLSSYVATNTESVEANGGIWTFNGGIHIKPTEQMHIGVSYIGRARGRLTDGTATFDVPRSLAAEFPTTSASTTYRLPDRMSIGFTHYLGGTKDTYISGQITRYGWDHHDGQNIDYGSEINGARNRTLGVKLSDSFEYSLALKNQFGERLSATIGAGYHTSGNLTDHARLESPASNGILLAGGVQITVAEHFTAALATQYFYGLATSVRNSTFNTDIEFQRYSIRPSLSVGWFF